MCVCVCVVEWIMLTHNTCVYYVCLFNYVELAITQPSSSIEQKERALK